MNTLIWVFEVIFLGIISAGGFLADLEPDNNYEYDSNEGH
jgi:hypothetical protein